MHETPQRKKEKKQKVIVSEQVSAMIQSRIPEKLSDLESFVLDCSISTGQFSHSLCDLGSSVSLMPYNVDVRLRIIDISNRPQSLLSWLIDPKGF